MSSIYIHIPFCKKACNYCDFYFSTTLTNKTELVNAIVEEIKLRKDYLTNSNIETIYFGGGTPSLLKESEFEIIFNQISKQFNIVDGAEITIECNPDDISTIFLTYIKYFNINRLSIGLQSFDDHELKWMNRLHVSKNNDTCVKLAQDKGFENISVDLIYGSKFSNNISWQNNLKKVIALQIQHISAYNLTIEGKTKLNYEVKSHREQDIDPNKSAELYELLVMYLSQNGFTQYEISNFCKEPFYSKHNTNYWKQQAYLGLGPAAHSYNLESRQWNISNLHQYIKNIKENKNDYYTMEVLSEKNKFNEMLLTSLRTIWGLNLNQFKKKYSNQFILHFEKKAQTFIQQKLMTEKDGIYSLTNKGFLLADKISSDMFVL